MRLEKAEWKLVLLLAAIHFAHAVDFVIMMPLAPILMEKFSIGPDHFSLLVSAYTWTSCFFGVLGAIFIDRWDRRTTLLVSFFGFIVGTFLCSLAPTAGFLLAARALAGAFSGIMVASEFAIVADLIPEVRRGTALGVVMAAFPVASILGVPFGIFLANAIDWHTPFGGLALACLPVWFLTWKSLPSVRAHLEGAGVRASESITRLFSLLMESGPRATLAFSFILTFSAFMVIPFIAASMTANVGLASRDLDKIYLAGGAVTFFTSQILGRMTDRFGKLLMFKVMGCLSLFPIWYITNLSSGGLPVAILATVLFMSLVSGRYVPAMALMSAAVNPQRRGSFMSLNTSCQNLAAGLAAYVSGQIVVMNADGRLENYQISGYFSLALSVFGIFLAPLIPHSKTTQTPKH